MLMMMHNVAQFWTSSTSNLLAEVATSHQTHNKSSKKTAYAITFDCGNNDDIEGSERCITVLNDVLTLGNPPLPIM